VTPGAEAAGGPIARPRYAGRLKVLPEALVASGVKKTYDTHKVKYFLEVLIHTVCLKSVTRLTVTKRSRIHLLAYLLPSSFILGSARTKEGDPVISFDRIRDLCRSSLSYCPVKIVVLVYLNPLTPTAAIWVQL